MIPLAGGRDDRVEYHCRRDERHHRSPAHFSAWPAYHPLRAAHRRPVDGGTLDRVDAFVAEGGTHQHVVLNVSKIVQASRDSEMRSIVAGCDLVNVDGQPVVWPRGSWATR